MLLSGFANAPVSKSLVFGLLASSILASLTDSKYLFYLHVSPHLWPYRQLWRLFAWQTCYTNSTELMFATMTLYHMRVIERLWGSRKFASFLLSLYPITTVLTPLILGCIIRPLSGFTVNYLPAGPTPLIFALLAQYHACIPHVYKYRLITPLSSLSASSSASTPDANQPSSASSSSSATVDGLLFSDKSTTYLVAAQLALSQVPGSLLAAAVGWAAGVAWRDGLLPNRLVAWRIPHWLAGSKPDVAEGFEGLRRRLEGEGRATGVEQSDATPEARRRGMGHAMLDQFRGSF